jgi:hypothetical protein
VVADGLQTDHQLVRDGRVALASGDHLQHLPLALGQRRERRGRRAGAAGEVVQNGGHRLRQPAQRRIGPAVRLGERLPVAGGADQEGRDAGQPGHKPPAPEPVGRSAVGQQVGDQDEEQEQEDPGAGGQLVREGGAGGAGLVERQRGEEERPLGQQQPAQVGPAVAAGAAGARPAVTPGSGRSGW